MYENGLMAGYVPEEGIRSALKHGTLAIGQLGLAETLQILIGTDHTTEKGMELAKKIEELFKKRCAEYKNVYKLNFGVYFTPAENLCYTAMKKFQDAYVCIVFFICKMDIITVHLLELLGGMGKMGVKHFVCIYK